MKRTKVIARVGDKIECTAPAGIFVGIWKNVKKVGDQLELIIERDGGKDWEVKGLPEDISVRLIPD